MWQAFKKHGTKVLIIVCTGVFIYAGYNLVDIYTGYNQSKKVAADVRETYYQGSSPTEKNPIEKSDEKEDAEEETARPEFDALLEENGDVVGWLAIDDTNIDYPILQSADNQDYLTRDFNKEESMGGSIFLDYRNDIDSNDRNTIVYGHRMKDGSMFQHLTKFLDEEFFDSHRTFDVETLNHTYEAEIFAVFETTTDFYYIQTDFESDAKYEQLLTEAKDKTEFDTGVDLSADDNIITLSTCDYELDADEGRLVVQAKLVEK